MVTNDTDQVGHFKRQYLVVPGGYFASQSSAARIQAAAMARDFSANSGIVQTWAWRRYFSACSRQEEPI